MSAEQIIEEIRQLCALAGIEFESFLSEVFACLGIRVKDIFTPNRALQL